MKQQGVLNTQIYVDADTPNMSVGAAEKGIAIVQEIAPWIRINDSVEQLVFSTTEYINGDDFAWPKLDGDLNVVLTQKNILGSKLLRNEGSLNLSEHNGYLHYIGLSHTTGRANSNRVALANVAAIILPQLSVAHDLGHLLGVHPRTYKGHCIVMMCVMNALLPEKSRQERTFCSSEAETLFENADRLRLYKAGQLAVRPHAKIFSPSQYM